MTGHTVAFDEGELARIRECCQALGIAYVEFIHQAVMDSVEQLEGYARDEHQELRRQERLHQERMNRASADTAPTLGELDRSGRQDHRNAFVEN